MIELLGVGVPRKDGWLMHRVCARMLRGELTAVCSVDPAERGALLTAISGGAIPKEGRVWVSGVPLVNGRVARVRQLVASIDLASPLVERRSVIWNCLSRHPRLGGLNGLFRFPRASERRGATRALARVGLQARSGEPVSALSALDRTRLRMARSLWRDPEFLVVAEPETALSAEDAAACLDLLKRLSREERVGVVVSGTPSSMILQRADRVIDLHEGLLIFDGIPADLLRRLGTPSGRGVRQEAGHPGRGDATRSQHVLHEKVTIPRLPLVPVLACRRPIRNSCLPRRRFLVKRLMAAILVMVGVSALVAPMASAQDKLHLTGSGASFPFPLYSTWFKNFSTAQKSISVDYQAKGSGAGIQDFINHTVDFAASDAAMTDEEIAKVPGGVQLLPMTAGEIALAYNLAGVKGLKLPRDVYAGIFLGKVTKWSDPKIKAANAGATLPDQDITVVRRADSSGTTFVFTTHLSATSEEWKKGSGAGTTVKWPSGDKLVASPKNDGVAATIRQTPGAIGYVEYAFAKFAKLEMASLQNKAGQYVAPGGKGGEEALASVKLPADLRAWLPDPEGAQAYPIATYTWLLLYKKNPDAKKAAALRELVAYCLTEGQKVSGQMGYIPLPASVASVVKKAAENVQ